MSSVLDKVRAMPPTDRLAYWIYERERVRRRKEAGKLKPWTKDPIFQSYRFCNVHREDDKVTRWIVKHWRRPHRRDQDLWFAMATARFINSISTLTQLDYPVPWKPRAVRRTLERIKESGLPVFGGAYMIRNNKEITKTEYVVDHVLDPLWKTRSLLRPTSDMTLGDYCSRLKECFGIGGFMAGQIIADLKYVKPLSKAIDWGSFAVSGPGSRRGLNRVLERSVKASWNEITWWQELISLKKHFESSYRSGFERSRGSTSRSTASPTSSRGDSLPWPVSYLRGLHAQDLQNCLCEFDKYERALWGEGRPKQRYEGV